MSYPITIGTQYLSSGKAPRLCTVVDIHLTYNLAGELVRTGYVCEHEFLGQMIREIDVNQVTVARGIWRLEESKA